ncbi:hypothetical protein INR49_005988 [Caranx melampygus]|nr:hypothetical protein INR49_005988 [Caranx melampygus]
MVCSSLTLTQVSSSGLRPQGALVRPPLPPTPTFNPSQSRRNNIPTGRNRRYKHRDQLDRVTEPLDPDGTGSRSACNVHSGHRAVASCTHTSSASYTFLPGARDASAGWHRSDRVGPGRSGPLLPAPRTAERGGRAQTGALRFDETRGRDFRWMFVSESWIGPLRPYVTSSPSLIGRCASSRGAEVQGAAGSGWRRRTAPQRLR